MASLTDAFSFRAADQAAGREGLRPPQLGAVYAVLAHWTTNSTEPATVVMPDLDYASGDDFRVVQLTPPGSGTSILFGVGITDGPPGSVQGLQLVVPDIEAARAQLIDRGADVTDVFHDIGGVFYHHSPAYEIPGLDPDRRDYSSFARFPDPDGNGWVLQEVATRASGR